jgi:Fic family protein
MLEAIWETATWTTAKIRAIRQLLEHTTEYVREMRPNIYRRELVELIFMQPYCRIANVVDANIAKRQTASNYLKELAEIGVLKELKVGKEKLFLHPRFLTLLTDENHQVELYRA